MTVDVWKPQSRSINRLLYWTMTTCRKSYESLWTTLLINDLIAFPSSTHWRLWRSGPNVFGGAVRLHGAMRQADIRTAICMRAALDGWRQSHNPRVPRVTVRVTSCLCRVLRPGWSWARPELQWLPRQPPPPPGSSLQCHSAGPL